MTIFYFTSTGNSLAAAKKIGGENCGLLSIPQLMREKRFNFSDDIIGLVCPVYYFGIPKIVKKFLEKARWQSKYSFAALTCGGNAWATLYNLQKLAKKHGQHFDYMNSISTAGNYLPRFDMADTISALSAKTVGKQIRAVMMDINNQKINTPAASAGQRVIWHIAQLVAKKTMSKNMAKKYYFANESCTKCGICARVCPAGNISVSDKVTFGEKCEVCLACLHLCPQNALHLRGEKSAARFRNPDISLAEIIAANDQMLT
jgi:ferredoxin